jgi:hypothetical protein
MRAKEFTINIPIHITLNGDGDPEISMPGQAAPETTDQLDQNPVMVPPLQQGIELAKASLGKNSPVIDKITQDHPDIGDEPPADSPENSTNFDLERIKKLISPSP